MARKKKKWIYNYRIAHVTEMERRYPYLPPTSAIRVKIVPKIRFCEIRKSNCQGNAYRKVKSRYGDRWTCDNCARDICKESENNWFFYPSREWM